MTQKSTPLKFIPVYQFPEQVEERIATFLSLHPGNWLHACVGDSKVGIEPKIEGVTMTTLDLDETRNPDICCDVYSMAQNSEVQKLIPFDGVISDPIWKKIETCASCKEPIETTKGISYPRRRELSYAVRDVLKIGGNWLFNGLWDPSCKGMEITPNKLCPSGCELGKQSFNSYRNLALLFYLKKVVTD